MKRNVADISREEVKAIFRAQRAGYKRMERDRLREKWHEPTLEEKIAFDHFVDDVLRHSDLSRKRDSGIVSGTAC